MWLQTPGFLHFSLLILSFIFQIWHKDFSTCQSCVTRLFIFFFRPRLYSHLHLIWYEIPHWFCSSGILSLWTTTWMLLPNYLSDTWLWRAPLIRFVFFLHLNDYLFICLSLRKDIFSFLISFLSSLSFPICILNTDNPLLLSLWGRFLELFSPVVL